ncbi:hypothetical protein FRC02_007357 [Tulasnella sp. 418]|nr:hypothetical protein FRC02_007357 [Tulasnella sp. 418]
MSPLIEASNVFGWMSIACWILVYSPQIYENYDLQSGEGLSVMFVVIWLLGDLTNLFGAMMAGLIPTVIILALYYTLCDIILLFQIYYYRRKMQRQEPQALPSEQTQLLPSSKSSKPASSDWMPGARVQYCLAFLFIVGTGFAAWYINHPREPVTDAPEEILEWKSQVLGWISAVSYSTSAELVTELVVDENHHFSWLKDTTTIKE